MPISFRAKFKLLDLYKRETVSNRPKSTELWHIKHKAGLEATR